jgi:hypothetical protein
LLSVAEKSLYPVQSVASDAIMMKFVEQMAIRIEPVRTALTRFNPQRKTASTIVVYRMTFIVTVRI